MIGVRLRLRMRVERVVMVVVVVVIVEVRAVERVFFNDIVAAEMLSVHVGAERGNLRRSFGASLGGLYRRVSCVRI